MLLIFLFLFLFLFHIRQYPTDPLYMKMPIKLLLLFCLFYLLFVYISFYWLIYLQDVLISSFEFLVCFGWIYLATRMLQALPSMGWMSQQCLAAASLSNMTLRLTHSRWRDNFNVFFIWPQLRVLNSNSTKHSSRELKRVARVEQIILSAKFSLL